MSDTLKVGFEAILYRLTNGSGANGTHVAWPSNGTGEAPSNLEVVDLVGDLTIDLKKAMEAVNVRRSGRFGMNKSTRIPGVIEFDMPNVKDDAHVQAIIAAGVSDDIITFAALDGDKATNGTQGFYAAFEVQIEKSQPIANQQMWKVSLYPAFSAIAPQWINVGGASS